MDREFEGIKELGTGQNLTYRVRIDYFGNVNISRGIINKITNSSFWFNFLEIKDDMPVTNMIIQTYIQSIEEGVRQNLDQESFERILRSIQKLKYINGNYIEFDHNDSRFSQMEEMISNLMCTISSMESKMKELEEFKKNVETQYPGTIEILRRRIQEIEKKN